MESKTDSYRAIIVPIVKKYLPRAEIILYGSRARGDYRQGSDIDVALKNEAIIDDSIMTAINNDIEESLLPITFDIVDFYAFSKKMQEEILKEGKIWEKSSKK